MSKFQPWALPASIALLALSVLTSSVIIAVPIHGIVMRLDRSITVGFKDTLFVDSIGGFGR